MKADDHGKDGNGNNNHKVGVGVWKPSQPKEEHGPKALGLLLFAVIGATATTSAVIQLRRTFAWFYNQWIGLNGIRNVNIKPKSDRKHVWIMYLILVEVMVLISSSTLKAEQNPITSWRTRDSGSTNWGFREEAWKRHNCRVQEEYEEEMERVERIRRMQNVFNRERNKFKRGYESWSGHGPGTYQHHQYAQRDDLYWKSDTSYREQKSNARRSYAMSHHYAVLGLDRSRKKPYSDAEIKVQLLHGIPVELMTAFRAKAMEFHPDQHQKNKVAEAKFKEVMTSFEALKLERKNGKM